MGAMPSRIGVRVGSRLVAAITAICWLVVPSVALAATSSEGNGTSTAAIEVAVTPLVAEGRDDGDLILVDEEEGFVALFFSPTAPAEQRAVHEVRVRNTGDTPLSDVEVTDDQMGTILAASDGTTLAPGEELVTQAEMTFTFDEVITDRGGLVLSTTTASGTAEDGTVVSDTATTRVELVAVLSESSTDGTDTEDAAVEDEAEEEPAPAQLPAAGLGAATTLPLAAALLGAGSLLLTVSRPRTAAAARPRRRPAAAWRPRG